MTKTVHRTAHAAAKPAPAPAHVATRTVTTHTVASKPVQTAAAAAPAVAPAAPAPTSATTPIVDVTSKPAATPAPAQTAAAKPTGPMDSSELMFGGGALALIALAAAAIAMKRRRRSEEEWVEEEQMEPADGEPVAMGTSDPIFAEQPAIVAPEASAFAWDKAHHADQPAADDSDRLPGETWVERAYRGPSANNPSESLKTRLGRAAFFDKREREVAAGIAEPVDPDEGLPEAMIEEQESEHA